LKEVGRQSHGVEEDWNKDRTKGNDLAEKCIMSRPDTHCPPDFLPGLDLLSSDPVFEGVVLV